MSCILHYRSVQEACVDVPPLCRCGKDGPLKTDIRCLKSEVFMLGKDSILEMNPLSAKPFRPNAIQLDCCGRGIGLQFSSPIMVSILLKRCMLMMIHANRTQIPIYLRHKYICIYIHTYMHSHVFVCICVCESGYVIYT